MFPRGLAQLVSTFLPFATACALALLVAPRSSAQISLGGYAFDAAAAPDLATPLAGSHPEFGGGLTNCGTAATFPGMSLAQSLQLVLTDATADEWVFGKARMRLDFIDNSVVNGPGADLVVFEIGGAEKFTLSVFHDSICAYGKPVTLLPVSTGFTSNSCPGNLQALNAIAIDLDTFGVLPGASVRRLLLDNLGQPGGAVGADIAAVMALHSGPPVSGTTECQLVFQQGLNAGGGTYLGAVDTALAADFPGTNYSAAPLEYADGSPVHQLLFRFDGLVGVDPGQVPPGAHLARATLTLCTDGAAGSASTGTCAIHRLLQPFEAGTATWANSFGGNGVNADGIEASVAPVASVAPMTANASQIVDITSAVQAWADGAPNHGLVLLTASGDALGLNLAEAALTTLRPSLEVELAGKLGYAEAVADFSPVLSGGGPVACNLMPDKALGAPDSTYTGTACCAPIVQTVTLGVGGSISLEFTTISVSGNGSPEPDLWIYETGPDVEDTFVDLSVDGTNWVSVGKVFGSTSSLDIDQYGHGPQDLFRFVRLTDDPNEGDITGCSVGADIDAIAALAPNPWLNLGASLAGAGGAPSFGAAGALKANGPIAFALGNAKPDGSAFFVLGLVALNAPLKGGTLVPQPTVLLGGLPLGPSGSFVLPATWPAGIPAGIPVYAQCWIQDAGGPAGFAASNAITSVTQ